MAAPTEYYIRYRYTGQNNTSTSAGTDNVVKSSVSKGSFTVSGNTNKTIGLITRIVYKHYHTCTARNTWQLYAKLTLSDGTAFTSDTVDVKFANAAICVTNTFTNVPTIAQWKTWASIQTWSASRGGSSGVLYWRAVDGNPMDVYVYFYDESVLVDGASPPTVSGIAYADAAALGNSTVYDTFGYYVKGKSSPVITGVYQLDPNYEYLTAAHTLTLTNASGVVLYTRKQEDNAVFDVGVIKTSGSIAWTYNVLDNAGNSVTQTGTFTVLAYSAPTIPTMSVERYATHVDDEGNNYYEQADDGDTVRFDLKTVVKAVNSRNSWTLTLTYGEDGSDSTTTVTVATGTNGATRTWTQDRSILPATIDTASPWTFVFLLTDMLGGSATATGHVDEAGAFFDVEEHGVAVGMRSDATDDDRRFEVAEGYPAYLYGGIGEVRDLVHSLAMLGIQYGTVSPTSVAGSSAVTTDIVFDVPYVSPPTVIVSPTTKITNNVYIGRCVAAVNPDEVTAMGFTLRRINYSSTVAFGANWIAIGQINTDPNAQVVVTVKRPAAAMTGDSSQNCAASASSTYSSSYPAWKAFNGSYSTSWASAKTDSSPWIQLRMDVAMTNIVVSVYGRTSSYVHNPTAGKIQGSNDGSTWTDIGTFSGWSTTTKGALLGTVTCGNSTAYRYVRIRITAHGGTEGYVAIGNVTIKGEVTS